jgi:O-antigen/teichoic acid export membrane protein
MNPRVRQLAHFISGNISIAVSIIVNLVVTRLIIQKLGLETYGVVVFVLNVGLLVIVLGNALSGATSRYLALNYAQKEQAKASTYLSNTLVLVLIGGISVSFLLYIYIKFLSQNGGDMPIGFVEAMLISTLLSSLAGVFSSGTFVRERFIERDAINSITRIINGVVCGFLLLYLGFGLWAVAIGTLLGSLLRLVAFHYSCGRLLPEVKMDIQLVSRRHIQEVASFVGWMLLSYCGGYIVNSGTLMAVENGVTPEALGRFALAANVTMLTHQILGCFSSVTSPPTYKLIAVKDYHGATWQIEKFIFLSTSLGMTLIIVLLFEGHQLLYLWLGDSAPENMTLLLAAAGTSAVLMVTSVPISVFLAGTGNVRNYGIAMVTSGLTVVGIVYFVLRGEDAQLVLVALIPGVIISIKNIVMVLFYKKLFVFSPLVKVARRILGSVVLWLVTILSGTFASRAFGGDTILITAIRLVIIVLPLGLFTLFLFCSRHGRELIQRDSVVKLK